MKNRYTFFDLDNTLYKGYSHYVISDFADYLRTHNSFSVTQFEAINLTRKLYNEGHLDRTSFALSTIEAYYKGIAFHSSTDISDLAKKYWEDIIDVAWFHYSVELVQLLAKYTSTVLISGSPVEVLKYINRYIKFDEIYATEGILNNEGFYTGEFNMAKELATYEAKERIMSKEFKRVDPDKSFAFGDAESDIPLLNLVSPDNAFVIGEGKELLLLARKHGWRIFRHDDDIVSALSSMVKEKFRDLHYL